MSDKNWKVHERKVAAFFGTKRVPLSGSNSGHGTSSDSLDKELYIECKSRKDLPVLRRFKKVKDDAKEYEATPIIQIECGNVVLAVFSSEDFMEATAGYSNKLTKIVRLKRDSVASLYVETVAKASFESKLPVLALKEKGQSGFLIGVSVDKIEELRLIRMERGLV